ncbi:MAG: PAS domain S-box protein, partial [Gammaproteobacteria bacterium]|nr:PAS domain S-box protein [Gammaproteobacteria bacterium]
MGKFGRLKRLWSSITGRLVLGVIIVHLILTPLLFYGILLIVERSFESQFVDQVRNNTQLYAELLRRIVEEDDEQRRADFLYEAKIGGDVIYAEFINGDGEITRAALTGLEEELAFREDFEFGEHDDQVYFIAAPLFSQVGGQPLGLLKLGYDELSVQAQIDTAYGFGSLIAGGYIAFSTLLAIFFGRRLLRPVSSLRSFATRVAAGDRSAELHVDTDIFELRRLAEDLQLMHRSLVDQQQDLLGRELRLQAILNHAGEGIITIDDSGVIQSFNLAAEKIFGFTSNEVVGRSVSLLMPPPYDRLSEQRIRDQLIADESNLLGAGRRLKARCKNGEVIPVYLTVSKVQLQQETSFTGILHDLSAEEKKETELQQLSRAVEQSPVLIVITNTAGNIEYVNPSFCHVTGYTAEEVVGENPRFLNSGQTSAEDYRVLWETISNGGIWRGIFQNRTKTGDLVWLSSTVCPVHDQLGEITHYISIAENITDARRKESMLTQAMKLEAIGRMTDGISHDFNNLLTVIQGNLKFLVEDLEIDNEEHQELIEDSLSAARDGSELIQRLLSFSRRQELNVQVLNINKNLASMERLLQRSAPEITVKLALDSAIGNTYVDAARFESAVLNMVTNARDAMPEGGTIAISTAEETVKNAERDDGLGVGNYVVVTVEDNGIGMDEETRNNAIEPFFTTKPIGTGTGLGLTMVHDFVRQCGGELHIDSAPNEGTTIKMFLPSSRESEDLATAVVSDRVLPTGTETILVVEDREGVRRFACRILGRLGYQTYQAEDASAAMSALRQHQDIDLLFSDI